LPKVPAGCGQSDLSVSPRNTAICRRPCRNEARPSLQADLAPLRRGLFLAAAVGAFPGEARTCINVSRAWPTCRCIRQPRQTRTNAPVTAIRNKHEDATGR
jgi:hypothetical protein